MLNSDDVERLDKHAKILRTIWMMSERRPLSEREREMLKDAIEAIEDVAEQNDAAW